MAQARSVRQVIPLLLLLVMVACQSPGPTAPTATPAVASGASAAAATSTDPEAAATDTQAPAVTVEPASPTATAAVPTDTRAPASTATPAVDSEAATAAAATPTESEAGATDTSVPTVVVEPTATVTAEAVEPTATLAPSVNMAFILDASGSMLAPLGGRTRLVVAQDAVAQLSAGLPSDMNASLWVYGHRVAQTDKAASCKDIEQVLPLEPVDAARFDTVAHSFGARGWTPITESIRRAAESLPVGANERNSIVLVSDGEETCAGDPCAMAAAVRAADARVTVHAIALNASAITRAQLRCIAEASGGTYQDADTAEELDLALEEATGAVAEEASGVLRHLGRPSSVRVSPDGEHVYVPNPGPDTLVAFRRDPGTGTLTFIDVQEDRVAGVDGLSGAFSVALSPDGKNVYVARAVFSRDLSTGFLTFVEAHKESIDGVEGLDGPYDVAVSPDGASVYVVDSESDALAVFARHPDTGALTFVEAIVNGVGGVEGLDAVLAVAVSPDGEYVYTASNPSAKDDALVVFSRDPSTGALTYLKAYKDGVDGLDGLQGGTSVVTSSDNRYVYVVGRIDDAVAIFGREPGTGELVFVGAHRGNIGGRPRAAAISPDGRHLYVVTDQADTILAFERDSGAGTLTFVEMHTDNVDGVDGLEWAIGVTVSPDGKHVYVAGFDDQAVVVFRRDPATGALTFVEVVRNAED